MEQAFELVPASGAKEVAIGLRRALALLLQGYDYGQELGRPVWEFAVEIAELKAAGATNNDLRWLAHRGYAEHAIEKAANGSGRPCFGPVGGPLLDARTCFVLTATGVAFARR